MITQIDHLHLTASQVAPSSPANSKESETNTSRQGPGRQGKTQDQAVSGSGIQVIDRLVALLDALARNGGGASLKVLAAETGLHPSTAFRILASAGVNGLIERGKGGQYGFGARLAAWAALRQGETDLRALARPVMEWLRDQVEETVNLTLREGDEVVYVERATPHRMMRVEQVIGSRAPLHVTAVGKLLLACGGETVVRDYAARTGLPAFTEHTLTQFDDLWRLASQGLAEGYAFDNEEAEIGVGCIGVLIRDPAGDPLAGLSISSPRERRRDEWAGLIREAAKRIEERLATARGA